MNTPNNLPPPEPRSGIGHETSDVHPKAIGLFALGLTLMVALVLPLLSWAYWQLESSARKADPLQNPLASDQTPPLPRLQVDPTGELIQIRREESERLSSYGWIDRQSKVVHIPIQSAMNLVAEQGFPEPDTPAESSPEKEHTNDK
jgi:hypothetical protein